MFTPSISSCCGSSVVCMVTTALPWWMVLHAVGVLILVIRDVSVATQTKKINVSLQASSDVLSFYHWQKSQIVRACVHVFMEWMEEKPRGISKPPTPVWPIGEASCSPFHPSDGIGLPQTHPLWLYLRPLDLNLFSEHPASKKLQSSASSYLKTLSDKPGRSIPTECSCSPQK